MASRLKMISLLILVVSVALASASVGFAATDNHMIELTPTSGCPGTQVILTASLPYPGVGPTPATVATGAAAAVGVDGRIMILSDPDGLVVGDKISYMVENGILSLSGTFIVGDVPCARPYTVTVALVEGGNSGAISNGAPQILDSVSTVFVVGGNGCPRLPVCMPVGGVVMPTSKLEIVAPFAALAGLLVAVSAVAVVKKRRD